jgi:Arc/MetJ-type ribon-helix-helix transcriptional regulator
MTETFPPELDLFVRQELASGRYKSEEELVIEAVRLLRDTSNHQRQFQEELQGRLGRLERGEGIQLEDDEALEAFFDEIETEACQEPVAKERA